MKVLILMLKCSSFDNMGGLNGVFTRACVCACVRVCVCLWLYPRQRAYLCEKATCVCYALYGVNPVAW
jgi:hypothetical protein